MVKWKDYVRDFPTFVIKGNDVFKGLGNCDIHELKDLMFDNVRSKD